MEHHLGVQCTKTESEFVRLDESEFMRLAVYRELFGAVQLSLVELSASVPGQLTSSQRERSSYE